MNRLLAALALTPSLCLPSLALAQAGKPGDKPTDKPAATQPKKDAKPAEATKDAKPSEDSKKAMEQAWEKAAAPGAEHKRFAEHEGEFEMVSTTTGPDGSTSTEKGTSTNTMVLGGRFLKIDFKGRHNGKFMTGTGMIGFDSMSGKYQQVWADTMATTMMYMTGTASKDDPSTITFTGAMSDPASKMEIPFKQVYTSGGKDAYTITMFMTVGGKDIKIMDAKYTRVTGDKKDEKKSDKDAPKGDAKPASGK